MVLLAGFPRQLRANSRPDAQTYSVVPGHYAVHGQRPDQPAPGAAYYLSEGTIAVFKGSPDQADPEPPAEKLSPVYALMPGGSPAVPTGLVFIRFGEGTAVNARAAELERAGYEIAETLPYAPNAAWVRARSGSITDALSGITALEKLPGAESVELQMLMESARR